MIAALCLMLVLGKARREPEYRVAQPHPHRATSMRLRSSVRSGQEFEKNKK